MEKPTPPEDWECCESECSPCVWDNYYEALREWNAFRGTADILNQDDDIGENEDE